MNASAAYPRILAAIAVVAVGIGVIATAPSGARKPDPLPGKIVEVGANSLGGRGLNSTMAVGGRYAYAGSFADATAENGGVKVIDIRDPARPTVAGTIAGRPGLAPLELRVWRRANLLLVLNDRCRPPACESVGQAQPDLSVYDIAGRAGRRPELVAREPITPDPHEFYLWQDPKRPARALAYVSTPASSGPNISAFDVSRARVGRIERLATWELPESAGGRFGVHAVGLTPNGKRALVSAYDLGYLILSTAGLARDEAGAGFRELTALEDRVTYDRVNGHSFAAVPGRRLGLTTDEIFGCPWASMNVVDFRDPSNPEVVGTARVPPYPDPNRCAAATPVNPQTGEPIQSFSPHDPTATCDLALVSWFGAGVQAFSLRDPKRPRRVAEFRPDPLPVVDAEHPHLQRVAMHSYPIIQAGLVYVLDVRNGLYVLRYEGPHSRQVRGAAFLEGNSNLSQPECRPSRRAR